MKKDTKQVGRVCEEGWWQRRRWARKPKDHNRLVDGVRSCRSCALLIAMVMCGSVVKSEATLVEASFDSPGDVPITASSYAAAGNTIELTLNHSPLVGARLTVVRNTGLGYIQGCFDNLAQGQAVVLGHGGLNYWFTANYHGNDGNDLVLQWKNVRPFAWGQGTHGKLGRDSTANSAVPVAVLTNDALWNKAVVSGAAGAGHSLAVCSDGSVASWGLNTFGQLGNDSTTPSWVPVAVTNGSLGGKLVVAVSAGVDHSLALCSDGSVYSWGRNTSGQLGDGTTSQRNRPVAVSASGILSGKTVIAISAGSNHSLALCSDGILVAWGWNANGELGNGGGSDSPVPVVVSGGALTGKTVVAIAAGANHSLALCSDGTLVAWGINNNGQLGDNTTTGRTRPVAVVTSSGALAGKIITGVAAGGAHSLALCSDGTIAAWGQNIYGQLGINAEGNRSVPTAVHQSGVLLGKPVVAIFAGAYHSLAFCSDGHIAAWGDGTYGQLGNNSMVKSSIPALVTDTGLEPDWVHSNVSVFSGAVTGPVANHSLALVASPQNELSHFGVSKEVAYVQTSFADPVSDPDSPFSFRGIAYRGSMGGLLPSSSISPPAGGTGIAAFENGSFGLRIYRIFNSKAAMDAAYPSGNYLITVHTTTPRTYQIALPLGIDNYPIIPKLTSVSNATWINGILKITNPSNPVTLTWNNPGNKDTTFQIDNTGIAKGDSVPATEFTIPANALAPDSYYRASVGLLQPSGNVAVPGLAGVVASSYHETKVQFQIQVGSPELQSPAMYLVMKNHNQVQTSNNDPVDGPNPWPDADLAPYSLTAEAPAGGILNGPFSSNFSIGFHPDTDELSFIYTSDSASSLTDLNSTHPNGTYTFPGGISVDVEGDLYPAVAKILAVNGNTPVWTNEGHLALDPSIDNTITWSTVTVPNFATHGHQSIYFESYLDSNLVNIEEERGALSDDPSAIPLTSLTIPRHTMTATYTYNGYIAHSQASDISWPSPDDVAIGTYESANMFMAVALKPQSITFNPIAAKTYPSSPFLLEAETTSGLPISFDVISGPATVNGNSVTLVGTGMVILRARQPGDAVFASAVSVTRSFEVTGNATLLAAFRSEQGLAADGSQDLLAPAGDGVSNLLKFAFNMIGTDPGQAPSLGVPNVQVVGISGTAGLPRLGIASGKLSITYIRRKASTTPGITYAVEFSNSLAVHSWATNPLATESTTSIDTNFERVTVTDNAVHEERFARVRVVGQ